MTGLILAALFAITQTPSPIPTKALDSPTARGQTVTKNPKNDKAPSTQPPTSIGPSAADQQHVGSTTKSEDTQQAIRVRELPRVSITKDWSDWGIWAFNGLLVLVGAFQLLVLWRQAKIMKAQAEIMAEHAAHLKGLVTAAEDNAKAASAAAEAASKNADFSKLNAEATSQNAIAAKASADALVASERAWVIIEEGFVHDVLGTQWFMRPKVKNLGKTIARIKQVSLGASLVPWKGQLPDAPIYSASKSFDFILCPNQEVPVGQVTAIEIPHEHLQAAMTGGAALYAFGIVEYLDLAERERVTAFVLSYDPPDNFVPYLSAPATYYQAT